MRQPAPASSDVASKAYGINPNEIRGLLRDFARAADAVELVCSSDVVELVKPIWDAVGHMGQRILEGGVEYEDIRPYDLERVQATDDFIKAARLDVRA